jgi:hypothetical protein
MHHGTIHCSTTAQCAHWSRATFMIERPRDNVILLAAHCCDSQVTFMGCDAIVTGTVVMGRGNARKHLAQSRQELRELLGTELFPGSLNVILKRPLRLREAAALRFDSGMRLLWPATMNGAPVWLYRWRWAPLHVVEVLSTVGLRQTFQLVDGSAVTLSISSERLGAVSLLSTLAWSAFWLGRRDWCYSNDRYYRRTTSWCRRLGATQARSVEG